MHSHGDDLRAEIEKAGGMGPETRLEWLRDLLADWHSVELSPVDRALCELAHKLTCTPGSMVEGDIGNLRAQGLDDTSIHDAVQVISYFNYINRVADAVHVDLDEGMPPYPSAPS